MKLTTIIYRCDNKKCNKELSQEVGAKHISIRIEQPVWAKHYKLNDSFNEWKNSGMIEGIVQFCNGKCIGEYFDSLEPKN